MEGFESIMTLLDCSLNTTRRRHIAGGILMSISLLFGGLAFTTFTIRKEEYDEQ